MALTAGDLDAFERPTDDGAAYYLRVALASGDEVFVPIFSELNR